MQPRGAYCLDLFRPERRFFRQFHLSRVLQPAGMEFALPINVLIAVPNCQGRVSPVFDVAARLLLVRLRGQVEVERSEIVLFAERDSGIQRDLRELGIDVLICGAISQGLRMVLEHAGIRVVPQICGDLEQVLAAYRCGKLNTPEFLMPGCCRHLWPSTRPLRRRLSLRSVNFNRGEKEQI
jgi:predicted Fe-Mo cluster-binding NifX family protein